MTTGKSCPQCGTAYGPDERFCPRDGAALRAPRGVALEGTVIAERYHVLQRLGEGGMGTVYLAEHVRMGRKSAVKVMNPGMAHDAEAIGRFNREAANASRINHPNVCAIYDFGETSDGLIYLAMEYIEGEPLTSVIQRLGAIPAGRAVSIAAQAADALSVAHELGIVHRDLKPDNIMIASGRDGADAVKVVDFGIAKAMQTDAQQVTRTGLVVGTPEYMSPEQLAGDPLDGRSDLYSLGIVLFHMLTGMHPFPAETVQESMVARLTDAPKTLREVRGDRSWPKELQRVLDRALARSVATRYASAAELARDLRSALAESPDGAAAAAQTVVIGAPVPPTRVVGTEGREVLETPRAAAPRVRVPVLAAALVVVALAGAASAYFTMARSETTDAPVTDTAIVATAIPATGRAALASSSPAPAVDERSSESVRTQSPLVPDAVNHAPTDSRAKLDEVAAVIASSLTREPDVEALIGAVDGIDLLLPRISSGRDSAEARFRRAQARGLLANGASSTEMQEAACIELTAIDGRHLPPALRDELSIWLDGCS